MQKGAAPCVKHAPAKYPTVVLQLPKAPILLNVRYPIAVFLSGLELPPPVALAKAQKPTAVEPKLEFPQDMV